jgi:hypothetical protein
MSRASAHAAGCRREPARDARAGGDDPASAGGALGLVRPGAPKSSFRPIHDHAHRATVVDRRAVDHFRPI